MKTKNRTFELEDGWTVESNEHNTAVKITLDKIKELSADQIGIRVKNLIPKVELTQLKFEAQRFTLKYKSVKPRQAAEGIAEYHKLFEKINALATEDKDSLLKSQEVTWVKSVFQMLRNQAISFDSKAREKQAREYVGRRYSTVFLEVAKRNGFNCEYCKTSTDLVLYPTNNADRTNIETRSEPTNLQIVCGTCIWDKNLSYDTDGSSERKTKKATN